MITVLQSPHSFPAAVAIVVVPPDVWQWRHLLCFSLFAVADEEAAAAEVVDNYYYMADAAMDFLSAVLLGLPE